MSRTWTRIIGVQPVGLALLLAGCPSGLHELSSLDEQGEDDGEQPTDDCQLGDPWEPNATADQPSSVAWLSSNEWTSHHQVDDASLCAGEDDWYAYDVESLGYVEHYVYIRALIEEAGLCGADCGQPVLTAGPEHAMTVEVYRAHDMTLLTSATDDDGVLMINAPGGQPYAHDLLIHVFSETVAEYAYRLSVEVRNYDGEDECEC